MATGHVERRGKRGYTTMVIEHDPNADGTRNRPKEVIPLPPGTNYLYKDEAEKVLYARLADINRGMVFPTKPVTLAEYIPSWLAWLKVLKRSPKTLDGYKYVIKHHILPALGKLNLIDITPEHLRSVYSRILKAGLSPRTAELTHSVLHAVLGQALVDAKVFRNVADAVKVSHPRLKAKNVLSPQDVDMFLERIKGSWVYEIAFLALHTGLRRGELLGLHWDDIDLGERFLFVQRAISRIDRVTYVGPPKTPLSERIVPLDDATVAMLADLRKRNLHTVVFCDEQGEYLLPDSVSARFAKEARKAGFEIRFKDQRHTFATNLLNAGGTLKDASAILGHSSVRTTGDSYVQPVPESLRRAIDKHAASLESAGRHQLGSNSEK